MKVLLIGGTGVISTAVVQKCIKDKVDLTCINRGKTRPQYDVTSIKVFNADINNESSMTDFFLENSFDVIVDFICFNKKQLIQHLALYINSVKQIIFISTDSIYKVQHKEKTVYREDNEQGNDIWNYSTGKIDCESYLIKKCKQHNVYYTIIRPSITYGNTRIPFGFAPAIGYHYSMIYRLLNHKPLPLWNNGDNVTTMMRVEDFADNIVSLFGNSQAYNDAFNISGDNYASWSDIICIMAKRYNVSPITMNLPVDYILKYYPEKRGEFLVDRAYDHIVDNSKVKAISGLKDKYNIEQGINITLDFYEKHNGFLGVDYEYDGKIDRMINDFGKWKTKLSFINYEGRATFHDKMKYYEGYYFDNILIKCLLKFPRRVRAKIYRTLQGLLQ